MASNTLWKTIFLGLCLTSLTTQSFAQSLTTGGISGTVTDPSGAVVPAATVKLTNTNTNISETAPTNNDGAYRFAFVAPGAYKIAVAAKGFQPQERTGLIVTAGVPLTVGVQLNVATTSQTVDVVEGIALIQTENADTSTGFSSNMIQDMPNPGSDITYIAQTAPGVVMNTQSGYGNFTADGMPAISNLFTINGQNYNDPFLGINNSGASNLALGANDISEATVLTNAYSAQYGQYAGTQISYVTESGTNQFHGDAIYNWNGRAMNADQFFNNSVGAPQAIQ
jgi:Carboxypeptidase regulatory-like domain/TonB-dependent Receptor Plug Domain